MSNFFQNTQNYGFWNFDVWFLSRGKKSTVNCCLHECKHIVIKKKWKNQSISHPILCVTTKFVCNITTKRFIDWRKKWWIIELKSANSFPETEKMLYCAQKQSSLQSNSQIYIHFLKLRRCSNESTVPL